MTSVNFNNSRILSLEEKYIFQVDLGTSRCEARYSSQAHMSGPSTTLHTLAR